MLDANAQRFLQACGYSGREIRTHTAATQLLRDMHLYGDTALDHLLLLEKDFGVDFTGFVFSEYFPAEFSYDGKVIFFSGFFGLTTLKLKVINKYQVMCLADISAMMSQRRFASTFNGA